MEGKEYQNIIVMRHGERIDFFVESWRSEAARPWDPELIPDGHARALSVGHKLRTEIDYPVHRLFVSPFLRCVQTASGVLSGLRSNTIQTSNTIKASIQYGLSEIFSRKTIVAPPKDGEDWGFNFSELETVFPDGTVIDPTCEQINAELPLWEETLDDGRARLVRVILALADKYPAENLIFVAHGEAVRGVMNTFTSNITCRAIDYCGYLKLRREITPVNESFGAGKFELLNDFSNGITT